MSKKVFRRVLAMCLAMVLTVVSSLAVMAAEPGNAPGEGNATTAEPSPHEGDVVPDAVIPSRTTTVIVSNNSIDVSYSNKNAVSYIVEYKSYNGTWDKCRKITTTDPQATIAQLMRGGRYDIRIKGVNEKGKVGAPSKEANRFMRSCSVYVTARRGGFNVNVPKTYEGVTGFYIYWTRDAAFNRKNIMRVDGDTLNKTLGGMRGMTYYVRVVPISDVNGKVYVGVMNGTHGVVIK